MAGRSSMHTCFPPSTAHAGWKAVVSLRPPPSVTLTIFAPLQTLLTPRVSSPGCATSTSVDLALSIGRFPYLQHLGLATKHIDK
jgi:hypothetical protein